MEYGINEEEGGGGGESTTTITPTERRKVAGGPFFFYDAQIISIFSDILRGLTASEGPSETFGL